MKFKLRAISKEDGKRFIVGYASLFNVQSRMISENGKTFREVIRNGSFDEILNSENLNVVANVDHDMQKMLGRNVSGTLKLTIDNRGLKYEIEVPDTQLGNDTYKQVERGDYYESSFAYGARENDIEWARDRGDGMLLRYVNKVSALRDVAIVRNGAFKNTDVSLRNEKEADIGLCLRSESDNQEINVNGVETEEEETTEVETTEEETTVDDTTTTEEETEEVETEEEETTEEETTETVENTNVDTEGEQSSEDQDDKRSWEINNKKLFIEIQSF